MEIDKKTEQVLLELNKIGCRLTGSIARGQFQEGHSDIDIYCPYGKWEKAKLILAKSGWKLESCFIGHLASWDASPALEVSFLFDKQNKTKLIPAIELCGVTWKTY